MTNVRTPQTASVLVPSRYVYKCEALLPDLFLAYSSMTGALLEFQQRDWSVVSAMLDGDSSFLGATDPHISSLRERLRRNGLLVASGTDELEQVRALRAAEKRAKARWLSLTIAPTMQCNFRCTYCFEEHRQEFMTLETAQLLVDFIKSSLDLNPECPGVAITWFGGEPLMAPKIIEYVQARVNQECEVRQISSQHELITNAYLLDNRMIDRLMSLGEWGTIQVTIDGTPVVHDGRRMLISGRSTYARVVANASNALARGMKVVVRMNIDASNSSTENLRAALAEFAQSGAANLIPTVYLGTIIDSTPECSHMSDSRLSQQWAADVRMRFGRELLRLGFSSGLSLPKPRCVLCTADSPTGFVIAPSGLIFKCWNEVHLDASNAVGSLTGQVDLETATENGRAWSAYDPTQKAGCKECWTMPSCMGGCPWEARRVRDRGECQTLKFYPKELLQAVHAERAIEHASSSLHNESSE